MPNRRGRVYVHGRFAGIIEERDDVFAFTYEREYLEDPDAPPVSLTLPLRAGTYASRTFPPFFDGLLPEGWLLDVATRHWKLDPRDRMGILLTVCEDCIGAVHVVAEEPPNRLDAP